MVKITSKTSKTNGNSADNLSFVFPQVEKITIDKASLHIQLNKFKESILTSFSLDSLIQTVIILSTVWLPIVTSDFKPLGNLVSSSVKGCYTGFAFCVTVYILYKNILKPVIQLCKKDALSDDPEKMTEIILEKCTKK